MILEGIVLGSSAYAMERSDATASPEYHQFARSRSQFANVAHGGVAQSAIVENHGRGEARVASLLRQLGQPRASTLWVQGRRFKAMHAHDEREFEDFVMARGHSLLRFARFLVAQGTTRVTIDTAKIRSRAKRQRAASAVAASAVLVAALALVPSLSRLG